MNILRIINTLILAGILSALVLILVQLRAPIVISQPVEITGADAFSLNIRPIHVTIDNEPLQVEINR